MVSQRQPSITKPALDLRTCFADVQREALFATGHLTAAVHVTQVFFAVTKRDLHICILAAKVQVAASVVSHVSSRLQL